MNDRDYIGVHTRAAAVLSFLMTFLVAGIASATPRTYDLAPLVSGLTRPTDIANAGDARLFVTEQPGVIRIIDGNGQLFSTPFLDIQSKVLFDPTSIFGEQGLLSLAFHPNYAANRYFFVSYVNNSGNSVIARFQAGSSSSNQVDPGTESILLTIGQPDNNHNVAQVRFGSDGYLYITTGDGGYQQEPRCTPQETNNLLGKVLRIDVNQNVNSSPYHGIPASNPFAGPGDPLDEIWAIGLRNPWRMSFDRLTGAMYIGDPGQNEWEEVNFEPAGSPGGRNYGWKMMEGRDCRGSSANCAQELPGCDHPSYTPPAFDYAHISTRCAVIGGYVYRGQAIPALAGYYVFGDFCGQMWAARESGGSWDLRAMNPFLDEIVAFGEDAAGELFTITKDGTVYAIVNGDPNDPNRGVLAFDRGTVSVQEGGVQAVVRVTRTGGSDGAITVNYATSAGTATAGADYSGINGILSWQDGDSGDRGLVIPINQDQLPEGTEDFTIALSSPTGGATLGVPSTSEVFIEDDDVPSGPCVQNATTLCLNDGRFRVTVNWRTPSGDQGLGQSVPITADAGWFWFFRATNPELFIKVLDACSTRDRFWVFAGGLTDVETSLVVVDTQTGVVNIYDKPLGVGFEPIRDTQAFATCP